MLEKIKSDYFVKNIFTFLEDINQLKIIKSNKSLQNLLNINIINYKFLSRRYIIFDTKGKGKMYDAFTDILLFEGEYIKGIKNGIGIEYELFGNKIFEGNYLNGIRNGFGKEYNNLGYLLFEGEYLNGKRWNGREYDFNQNLICELKYGKIFINGIEYKCKNLCNNKNELFNVQSDDSFNKYIIKKEYYDNGVLKFEGEYLNGVRNGYGKLYDKQGRLQFEGKFSYGKYFEGMQKDYFNYYNSKEKLCSENEISNRKKTGKGKEYNSNGKLSFEGEYLYNSRKKGKEYHKGKLEYEGEYLYDRKWNGKGYDENGNVIYEIINGKGKCREYNLGDELIFEGEYLNGKRSGKGKEYNHHNGNLILIFEGEYLNGGRNKGKEYDVDDGEIIFEGEYLDGKKWNGKGKEYFYYNHQLTFDGEYLNGKRWKGKMYNYDSNCYLSFEGELLNGYKHGKGKEYNEGKLLFEGEYLNGKRWNGKITDYDFYGNLIFESEILEGNGKGKEYYNGELLFEGEYLNGERWNGKVKEYNENGLLIFEGEIKNGIKQV